MNEWWSRSDGPIQLSSFVVDEWLGLALIFLVVFAFTFFMLALLRPTEDDPDSLEPAARWFGPLTPGIAGMIPSSDESRKEIQLELYLAGYSQPQMLDNFLSMRSLLTWLPLFAGLGLCLYAPTYTLYWIFGGLILAVLGFAVPRVLLQSEGNARAERLRRGLPVLMDTLSLCLSTGNSLQDSFRRSGESLRRGYPDLHHEVRVVNKQAELRSLEHALLQWKERIPLPELSSLVFLLAQGDKLGTDVTRGLLELSSSYRINARQAADAAANRLSFYMIFPTVLCLFVSGAILIAGPSILAAVKQGVKIREDLKKVDEKAKQLREEGKKAGEVKELLKSNKKSAAPKFTDGSPGVMVSPRPEL